MPWKEMIFVVKAATSQAAQRARQRFLTSLPEECQQILLRIEDLKKQVRFVIFSRSCVMFQHVGVMNMATNVPIFVEPLLAGTKGWKTQC